MRPLLPCAALTLLALAGPAHAQTRIGVTMTSFDNPFLTILLDGMTAEAERLGGVELSLEDAQLDVGRQLSQVENFVADGLDAIIVNVVDGASSAAITRVATEAGIPLVYVNHPPAELEAGMLAGTAFVGSDEVDSGTMQAEEVCRLLGGKGRALVMMGPLENNAAIVRTQDVREVLARPECDGIEVVDEQVANWARVQAQDLMTNWLTTGVEFDAVIANNDEMAIGAIQAMKAGGMAMEDVVVAGIDATPDGLVATEAGELDVTVFQDATRQGEVAMQTAVAMAAGDAVEPTIWVPFELVTPETMASYQ